MAGVFGLVAVVLGLCLAVAWWPLVVGFLKALLALSLLFWGLVAVVVAHSANKARRDYHRAVEHDPTRAIVTEDS